MSRMKATLAGVTIAESDQTELVEGNHYFPPESVNWEHMERARAMSVCPWKGLAGYYHVEAAGSRAKGAAWQYRHPFPWIRRIRGHVAFWGPVLVED
jgi:uncharacterized protein (DUF427 family)